ncbi:hypothetical protein [Streptomyces sp. GC420]|uniref:hypothetical protein n=1 Tax=Streptomyces sp. GC420 TaxID=2697568 RepID=UPI00141500A6|nr:hypothetical protein [Streptomyces sp. GC420]NBM19902.1 hypothetical protein [Streptomyces sp. GC420]
MAESVPVRCPACRREHSYTPQAFPCPCGAPVTLALAPGARLSEITHRTWEDSWVTVCCGACGREAQWPRPEVGCPCGIVLGVPVRRTESPAPPETPAPEPGDGRPEHIPLPRTAVPPRPAFRPVTIRTSRDAVTAAALYLKWLGFRNLQRFEAYATSGVGLRGPGLVAQVDPSTTPTGVKEIECLWLSGLHASGRGVFFSLAGYGQQARARADELRVPLFVMDLTGTPQPVNDSADDLVTTGA